LVFVFPKVYFYFYTLKCRAPSADIEITNI